MKLLTFPVCSVQRAAVWVLYLNVHLEFVAGSMTEADYVNAFSLPGQDYVAVCSLLVVRSLG